MSGAFVHGSDIWEIVIDADHGGEKVINFADWQEAPEIEFRHRSAYAQNYHLYMPPLNGYYWHWLWGKAMWTKEERYSAMGWQGDVEHLSSGAVTYANINGSAPTDQRIEWVMYTPSPGDDIHFLGLSFVIKSQVKAAGVIPLLKVVWSLDGTARYRTALINVDRERLTTQEGEISPNVHAYVPIDLVAKYLTLRISVVETAGRAGGMELYAGMLSYSNKSESREGQKSIPEGLSRVYT